jgi:hypothetical protein
MVRFDLICVNKHPFEGFFLSEESFLNQQMVCPTCDSNQITKKVQAEISYSAREPKRDYISIGKRPVILINEQVFDYESMPENEPNSLELEQLVSLITQELYLEDFQHSLDRAKNSVGRLALFEEGSEILILKLLQSGQQIH